jgi:hypothetical protein
MQNKMDENRPDHLIVPYSSTTSAVNQLNILHLINLISNLLIWMR